jgi:hypothetical protein
MAEITRPSVGDSDRSGGLTTGIYVARVISHLDPSFMGSIEVTLLKDQANTAGDDSQTFIVKYASPFFGYTPFEFMGKNDGVKSTIDGFSDTQKSYGMWFVPPDVGVNVLVLFVNGDPASGYWFACVPGRNINNMVPAIAGSKVNSLDAEDKKRYGKTALTLPVAEVNKRINGEKQEIDPEKYPRVVHPIADRFLEQGLLEDSVRGFNTSSPRREAPSMVFGISTPGPVDRRAGAKKQKIGKADSQATVPVSRLGGTQLVMDDGDDRYHRETSAADGPEKYVDLLDPANQKKGNEGSPTIPASEYFRVRTRTGHQILMHNSEDLIYIANARGTAWIELTSNGKIDIFSEDSISVHTKNDFNFYADRDFNLECGRNVNIKAKGRLNGDFNQNIHLRAALDMKVFVSESLDIKTGTAIKITTGQSLDVAVGTDTKITSLGTIDVSSGSALKVTSTATIDVGASGNIVISGSKIDLNGPTAATAAKATSAVTAPPLSTHAVPNTAIGDYAAGKYQAGTIPSIMKRVPMHEPWSLHEHRTPQSLTPVNTDREIGGALSEEYKAATTASQVSASAAHVAEINDYDANVPDPVSGKPVAPAKIDIPRGGIVLTADYFAPSRYGKRTAENLNTLDPSVRIVFAKAIKAFINRYYSEGWDMSVSECLRPLARSQALYDAYKAGTGPQAASPGNSWHNYGAAADILIYKDGKWDSLNKLGAYTGFAQQFLRTNGIHNNAGANDSGHFVPVQMSVGVPKAVKTGALKISDIMSKSA